MRPRHAVDGRRPDDAHLQGRSVAKDGGTWPFWCARRCEAPGKKVGGRRCADKDGRRQTRSRKRSFGRFSPLKDDDVKFEMALKPARWRRASVARLYRDRQADAPQAMPPDRARASASPVDSSMMRSAKIAHQPQLNSSTSGREQVSAHSKSGRSVGKGGGAASAYHCCNRYGLEVGRVADPRPGKSRNCRAVNRSLCRPETRIICQ